MRKFKYYIIKSLIKLYKYLYHVISLCAKKNNNNSIFQILLIAVVIFAAAAGGMYFGSAFQTTRAFREVQ